MADDDSTAAVLKALPLRILLVEDDELDVAVFRRAFYKGEIPCEIVRCRSGEEALEGLRDVELAIDLVVADHLLPGMSGYDLCVRLLADEPPFALVLLTGGGSEQMAIRALRAGIQDYIVKDASQEYLNLLPIVLPRVARRHRERQSRRQPRPAAGAESSRRGLADSAALARRRGGRVWLEEGAGGSPTLHFAIPLAADEVGAWTAEGEASGHAVEAPPGAGEGPTAEPKPSAGLLKADGERPRHVLIAHSNPIVTFVAARVVENEGCRFVAVENGSKAIEAIDRESFDLVLMGIRMPRLDGLEATRRIREREGSASTRVRIIGLGADAEAGEVEKCLEAGMDASVARPVGAIGLTAALVR